MATIQDQPRLLQEFLATAKWSLRRVMGPAWSALDRDDQEGLAVDVYARWAAPAGIGAREGLVRFVPGPRGPQPLLEDTTRNVLARSMLPVARVVGGAALEVWRREQGIGQEVEGRPAAAPVSEGDREAREAAEEEALGVMERLKTGTPSERALATLVELHMGLPALPGAPRDLQAKRRYSKRSGWIVVDPGPAYRDLQRYHALGRESVPGSCPTCRKLSRFFRIGTPEQIHRAIDDFIAKSRQA